MLYINNFSLKWFYNFSGYLILSLLVISNFLSLTFPIFGRIGTYCWFLSFIYLLIFLIKSWQTIFKIKYYPIYTIFVLLLFLVFIVRSIPTMIAFDGESTKVIACSLSNINNEIDYGYNKTCLYGYPARQYLIPSLPSLLQRNLINLNIGGSIYLIFGLLIFSSNALKFLKYSKNGDLITSISLSLLLHFHYFNYFAFTFEQSIFPFSFGLIIGGLILNYLNKKDKFPMYLFGFCFFYLIYSYTPSLSLMVLLMLIIFIFSIQSFRKKEHKNGTILMAILLISIITSLTSFNYRTDINIFNNQLHSQKLLMDDILKGFSHLFLKPDENSFISPFLFPLFPLLIILPIIFFPNWFSLIIFVWVLLTITISIVAKGYIYYPVFFRVHRSIVTIPVLLTYIIYFFNKKKLIFKNFILKLLLILIVSSGIIYYFSETKDKFKMELSTYYVIKAVHQLEKEPNNLIILDGEKDDLYLYPTLINYFFPKSTSTFFENGKYCSLPSGKIFLISKSNRCFDIYQKILSSDFEWIPLPNYSDLEKNLYILHLQK